MAFLYFSTEQLELLGQREKFMKTNYESLDGQNLSMELDNSPTLDAPTSAGTPKNSFSSRFLTRSAQRNSDAISHTKAVDAEVSKRRAELQKQIEETRKKLQSVS